MALHSSGVKALERDRPSLRKGVTTMGEVNGSF